jgi:hypothetical protein
LKRLLIALAAAAVLATAGIASADMAKEPELTTTTKAPKPPKTTKTTVVPTTSTVGPTTTTVAGATLEDRVAALELSVQTLTDRVTNLEAQVFRLSSPYGKSATFDFPPGTTTQTFDCFGDDLQSGGYQLLSTDPGVRVVASHVTLDTGGWTLTIANDTDATISAEIFIACIQRA